MFGTTTEIHHVLDTDSSKEVVSAQKFLTCLQEKKCSDPESFFEWIKQQSDTVLNQTHDNKTFIQLCLERNLVWQHRIFFKFADALHQQGVQFPDTFCIHRRFKNLREYQLHLLSSPHDLYLTLKNNHTDPLYNKKRLYQLGVLLIEQKDYIALERLGLLCYLIFENTAFDFNEVDAEQNSFLHKLFLICQDETFLSYLLPYLLEQSSNKFDASMTNNDGLTILHLAAYRSKTLNFVSCVLKHFPNIALDRLTSAGQTAFYFTIYNRNLTGAKKLLAKNAHPLLHGDQNFNSNPLRKLESFLSGIEIKIDLLSSRGNHDTAIKELQKLAETWQSLYRTIHLEGAKRYLEAEQPMSACIYLTNITLSRGYTEEEYAEALLLIGKIMRSCGFMAHGEKYFLNAKRHGNEEARQLLDEIKKNAISQISSSNEDETEDGEESFITLHSPSTL